MPVPFNSSKGEYFRWVFSNFLEKASARPYPCARQRREPRRRSTTFQGPPADRAERVPRGSESPDKQQPQEGSRFPGLPPGTRSDGLPWLEPQAALLALGRLDCCSTLCASPSRGFAHKPAGRLCAVTLHLVHFPRHASFAVGFPFGGGCRLRQIRPRRAPQQRLEVEAQSLGSRSRRSKVCAPSSEELRLVAFALADLKVRGVQFKLVAVNAGLSKPVALILEQVRRPHRVWVVFVRRVPIAWWTKLSLVRLDVRDAAHLGPKLERRE